MARGIQRNAAEAFARRWSSAGKSYEDAVVAELEIQALANKYVATGRQLVEKLAEALRPAIEAMAQVVSRFIDAMSAIDWAALAAEAAKAQKVKTALDAGIMTAAQARAALGLPDTMPADIMTRAETLAVLGGGGHE